MTQGKATPMPRSPQRVAGESNSVRQLRPEPRNEFEGVGTAYLYAYRFSMVGVQQVIRFDRYHSGRNAQEQARSFPHPNIASFRACGVIRNGVPISRKV